VRATALIVLLAALPCGAQDLPDPGRRLSPEEQKANPEQHPGPQKPPALDTRPSARPRDARACNNARLYYQMSCGAPGSYRSASRSCAEAYALYRENCP
jgi:hypothetical protein